MMPENEVSTTTYSFVTYIKHNIIINTNKILPILFDNNYPRKAVLLPKLPCKIRDLKKEKR